MASPTTPGSTNLGVAPNVGGLLCYAPCCIGLIFSIVAAIVEKQSRFVRFHAFQSLLLHGAWIVLWVALMMVRIAVAMILGPLAMVLYLLTILLGFAMLAVVILLMVKAYNNEEFELPVIGELARKWAAQV
jgi:uncharacterized membrane protein